MRFTKYLICFFCFLSSQTFAQDYFRVDSLKHFEQLALRSYRVDSTQREVYKGKIFDIYNQSSEPVLQFYSSSIIGDFYRIEDNYNSAIDFYFKALKFSTASRSQLDIAQIYDNLAKIYQIKGETGLLFEYINKSLSIRKELHDERGSYLSRAILSAYYRNSGQYTEALSNYFDALNFFIETKDSLEIARSYNGIGLIYKSFNNLNKALHYFKLSEEYYKAINSKKGVSTILNNIGTTLLNNGKYQDALDNFQKSLEIELELGNTNPIYTRYNNIGLSYIHLENFSAARFYIDQCITFYKKKEASVRLANSYETLAQYHEVKGNIDSAEFFYLKSYHFAKEFDFKTLTEKCSKKLSHIYALRGDFQLAYQYQLASREISDFLNSMENIQGITEQELEYLSITDREFIEANKRNTLYKFFLFAGALFTLLLLVGVALIVQVFRVRLGKKIAKELNSEVEAQQDELHEQGKDLMSKTLQLGNNNSEVSFVIRQLEILKRELGVQGKQKVQQIIINLEQHQNKDIWDEFEIRFSQVNSKFYEALAEQFPLLTSNERRLAALVFLNFSTKEIARITKQTYRSVLVAKSRLRKKLNLLQDEDLTTFLTKMSTT